MRLRKIALGWAVALLLGSDASFAQGVSVSRIAGALDLGAEASLQDVQSPGAPSRTFDRYRFGERITLSADGHVLTDQFLRYRVGGNFGLLQERIRASESAGSGEIDAQPYGYDALAYLLPTKPVSMRVFGSRTQSTVFQNFGTDTESKGAVQGSSVDLRLPGFPTTLTWQEMSSVSRTRGGFVENRRDETRELFQAAGSHFSEASQLTLRYRDEDVQDDSIPSVGDYRVRQVDGMAAYRWGDYFEKSFQASGRRFERTGTFEFDHTSASGNGRWDPTESLMLETRYNFERFVSDTNELREHIGSFLARHQLYESLLTSFNVTGDIADQTAREQTTYTADLGFDYRKHLLWQSMLLVDLDFRYQLEDSVVADTLGVAAGESLSIADLTGNFLANANVVPGSIEVFETLGGALLIEGIDYSVETIGDRTSVNPLVGGSLSVGDVVVVNYDFLLDPSAKTETRTQGFGIGWQRGGFRLRYDRDEADERLVEGEVPSSLLEGRRDTFQINLDSRRGNVVSRTAVRYMEDRLTTLDFDELSFQQRITWARGETQIDFHLLETLRDFLEQNRETETLNVGLSATWWPRPKWKVRGFADLRELKDSDSLDQTDVKLGLRADLRMDKVEVTPLATWTRRERGPSRTSDLRIVLRFRRSF